MNEHRLSQIRYIISLYIASLVVFSFFANIFWNVYFKVPPLILSDTSWEAFIDLLPSIGLALLLIFVGLTMIGNLLSMRLQHFSIRYISLDKVEITIKNVILLLLSSLFISFGGVLFFVYALQFILFKSLFPPPP